MARHRLSPNPIPCFAISAIRFLVWLLIIKQHGMLSPLLFAAERAPVQDHHRLHRGAPMEISEVCSDPRCADMQPSACWAITLFPHVTKKLPKFAVWFQPLTQRSEHFPPLPFLYHSFPTQRSRNSAFALPPSSGTFVFASPPNEISSITDFPDLAPDQRAYSFCYKFSLLPIRSYLTIPLFHAGSRWVLVAQDIFLMKLATAFKNSRSIISPGPCLRL